MISIVTMQFPQNVNDFKNNFFLLHLFPDIIVSNMEDKMYLQIFITFLNLDQIRDNKAKGPTKDKLTNIYTRKIWSLTRNI